MSCVSVLIRSTLRVTALFSTCCATRLVTPQRRQVVPSNYTYDQRCRRGREDLEGGCSFWSTVRICPFLWWRLDYSIYSLFARVLLDDLQTVSVNTSIENAIIQLPPILTSPAFCFHQSFTLSFLLLCPSTPLPRINHLVVPLCLFSFFAVICWKVKDMA